MAPSVTALFEYVRSKVSDQDILDFPPNDPGRTDYIRLWTKIWDTGEIPRKSEFDLSEVIGLTGWADSEKVRDPKRFRNFRRFTSVVGIALLHYGNPSDEVRPANYLAHDLITDLDRSDKPCLALLRGAFLTTREVLLAGMQESEYPFFTFGSMILAQIAKDWRSSESYATQLIEDEAAVRKNGNLNYAVVNGHFLLGLTNFDRFHKDWITFAHELRNKTDHEATQLVMDAIRSPLEMKRRWL